MVHSKRLRAFSLIELLSVLAIITILAAATVPALKGTLDGFNISGAADMAGAELSLARQTAISRNLPVEVRIYLHDDGTGPAYRVMALVIPASANAAAVDEWVTPGKTLPGNVLIEDKADYSTVISNKNTWVDITTDAPWEKTESADAPMLLRNKKYVAFRYNPDGSTNLPTGEPWCITLKNLRWKPSQGTGPAANYVSIVIDSLTGRSLTYQP